MLPVHLTYVINSTNYAAIPDMFNLAKHLGTKTIYFRLMQPTPYTKTLCLARKQKIELLKIIMNISRSKGTIFHNLELIKKYFRQQQLKSNRRPHCLTGFFNLFINVNRDIGLCCHNENLVIGSLRENTIKDAWNGVNARKIRLKCLYDFNVSRFPFRGNCEACQNAIT